MLGQEEQSGSFAPNDCNPRTSADFEAQIDLERLVWDPEYRNSVRHLLPRQD
ncbi:hypothetical protein [Pelagibius sp.]|uniref:hypothetical protein n=1 Tax=Pelagibius sp. TaxID=1931238 RepID=UPI002627FA0C|nr:hypothetical protein [Pelagibius sp.]